MKNLNESDDDHERRLAQRRKEMREREKKTRKKRVLNRGVFIVMSVELYHNMRENERPDVDIISFKKRLAEPALSSSLSLSLGRKILFPR